jgi:hypothetical protein
MKYLEAMKLSDNDILYQLLWVDPNPDNLLRVLRERSRGRQAVLTWENATHASDVFDLDAIDALQAHFNNRHNRPALAPSYPDPEKEYPTDSIYHPDNYLALYEKIRDSGWDFSRMIKKDTIPGSEQARADVEDAVHWLLDALEKRLPFDQLNSSAQSFYKKLRRMFMRWEPIGEVLAKSRGR